MRKFLSFMMAAAVSAPLLTALGCSEENASRPYSLTGEQNFTPEQQEWVDQHSIDQKGHYNIILHQQAVQDMNRANQGSM